MSKKNNFEVTISARISDELVERIERKVKINPKVYDNVSHFIRVALVKELRRCDE
jgi:Arc/MetJ-type ribon-helix-helix transcriptional regulator